MRVPRRPLSFSAALVAVGLALVPVAGAIDAGSAAGSATGSATGHRRTEGTLVRTFADEAVTQSDPAAASTGEVLAPQRRNGLYGVRWNPCEPITYRVNARGGYPGSVRHIRQAFHQVSAATGVQFVYQGTTNRIALRDQPDPRADITVSWATAAQVPQLAGTVAGLASTTIVARRDGVFENIKGQVAFDRSASLRRGFTKAGPSTWGQVYLHEISHVMGLDHVAQRRLVMHPVINTTNHTFGAGDRARLHQVGRAAGCVPSSSR